MARAVCPPANVSAATATIAPFVLPVVGSVAEVACLLGASAQAEVAGGYDTYPVAVGLTGRAR